MIELKPIAVREIVSFAESEGSAQWPVVPITAHRALSQARNPRARPDDVALIIATEQGKLVGYIGMLPDDFHGDAGPVHGAWLSTLWVHPRHRGRGIAKALLNEAFIAWSSYIAATRFTDEARQLYERSGRFIAMEHTGIRGYLRFNLHHLLPSRYPKWRWLRIPLLALDAAVNVFIDLRLKLWSFRRKKTKLEYRDRVDDDMSHLISQTSGRTKRGATELNWILQYPWITTGSKDNRYHFSSGERGFRMDCLNTYNDQGDPIAFAMLNIRKGNVQVPYCVAATKTDYTMLASALVEEMVRRRLNTITVINNRLAPLLRDRGPFWLTRPFAQSHLLSKALWTALGEPAAMDFQDGDGDAAFT